KGTRRNIDIAVPDHACIGVACVGVEEQCRMALDPKVEAALCLHRFGLGPRAGSIAAVASDARGALLAEINSPGAGRIDDPALLAGGQGAGGAFNSQRGQRAAGWGHGAGREASPRPPPPAGAPADMKPPDQSMPPAAARPNPGLGVPQRLYLDEAKARIHAA